MRGVKISAAFGLAAGLAGAVALAACDGSASPAAPTAASAGSPPAAQAPYEIGGVWSYSEETQLTLPGALAADLGIPSEGPVLHVTCNSPNGELALTQAGAAFTGTLEYQTAICRTKGGQSVPPPWPLPYHAVLSGEISGRALHIEQWDDPPGPSPDGVRCPKNGTLTVEGGVVTQVKTTGRCDLSGLPFQPAVATNKGVAVR